MPAWASWDQWRAVWIRDAAGSSGQIDSVQVSRARTYHPSPRAFRYHEKEMVRLGGLEPPTSGATIRRSNLLSYNRTAGHCPAKRGISFFRPVTQARTGTRDRKSAGEDVSSPASWCCAVWLDGVRLFRRSRPDQFGGMGTGDRERASGYRDSGLRGTASDARHENGHLLARKCPIVFASAQLRVPQGRSLSDADRCA